MSHTAGEKNHIADGTNPALKAAVTSANALKVDGSGVTQPVSGTVTATIVEAVASTSGALTKLDDAVTLACAGYGGATFTFDAGLTGTVSWELSHDGTVTWRGVAARRIASPATEAVAFTTNPSTATLYATDLAGATHVRVRCSAYSSGSTTGYINLFQHPITTHLSIAAGSQVVGTANAQLWIWNGSSYVNLNSTSGNVDAAGTTLPGAWAGARLYGFNGSTWDRLRSDITNGLDVDVTRAANVTFGYKTNANVHMDVQNASGTVGYMLVDLSDTTNWKHTATGKLILEKIVVTLNPTTSFVGDVFIGFLSSVTATNGTLNTIMTLHNDRQATTLTKTLDYAGIGAYLQTTAWMLPATTADTTWQTDVNLLGPDGNTSYPSGNGDLVMKLVSSAGSVDIGVTLTYGSAA